MNVLKKILKNFFTTKVREESAYKLDAEMLKAKICGHRSVEDKKDQNKIWTHKYSSKKTACPRFDL